MRRFLKNLKTWGLSPEVVVTDGSNLYPDAPGRILAGCPPPTLCLPCPERTSQARPRRPPPPASGAVPAGPAGPQAEAGATAQGPSPAAWADQQGEVGVRLQAPLADREAAGQDERAGAGRPGDDAELPARVEDPAGLRGPTGGAVRGGSERGAGLGPPCGVGADRSFLAVPELAKAIGMLAAEKFAKMIAFLKSPACRRVRTNNHVERVNRKLRYEEKARYKWRKRRTTVRFLVLLLDRCWRQERAIRNRWQRGIPAGGPGPVISEARGGGSSCVTGQILSGSARSVEFLDLARDLVSHLPGGGKTGLIARWTRLSWPGHAPKHHRDCYQETDRHDYPRYSAVPLSRSGQPIIRLRESIFSLLLRPYSKKILTVTDFGAGAIDIQPARRRSADSATSPHGNDAG